MTQHKFFVLLCFGSLILPGCATYRATFKPQPILPLTSDDLGESKNVSQKTSGGTEKPFSWKNTGDDGLYIRLKAEFSKNQDDAKSPKVAVESCKTGSFPYTNVDIMSVLSVKSDSTDNKSLDLLSVYKPVLAYQVKDGICNLGSEVDKKQLITTWSSLRNGPNNQIKIMYDELQTEDIDFGIKRLSG